MRPLACICLQLRHLFYRVTFFAVHWLGDYQHCVCMWKHRVVQLAMLALPYATIFGCVNAYFRGW